MLFPTKPPSCAAVPATQHPKPERTTKAQPFGIRAMWLHFAQETELRRLAKLHVRIELKKANLADLVRERQSIMNRCIRRMRRAAGKT